MCKVLERSRPNGWLVELVRMGGFYLVREWEGDEEDDLLGLEFENYADALASFRDAVAARREVPNWDRQAEYDDLHGTDNGYAPWQHMREC